MPGLSLALLSIIKITEVKRDVPPPNVVNCSKTSFEVTPRKCTGCNSTKHRVLNGMRNVFSTIPLFLN
jgi:hypothetical protein